MPRLSVLPLIAGSFLSAAAPVGHKLHDQTLVSHRITTDSVGVGKGWLVIEGGGEPTEQENARFAALAGGPTAKIVVIPTADPQADNPAAYSQIQNTFATRFGVPVSQITILSTKDTATANSAAFIKPIEEAGGVWIVGGRQWRLADAYNGTATLRALKALLARGGVIGGGSAGASIQASFLVRGQSNPDDNTVMMAPDHEVGFGLLPNSAVDQHVDARGRAADLDTVIATHPNLIGVGIWQSAAIIVHGNSFFVNDGEALIHDNKMHDGKRYYYLQDGDAFDLAKRVVNTDLAYSYGPVSKYPLQLVVQSATRSHTAAGDSTVGAGQLGSRSDTTQAGQSVTYSCNVALFPKNHYPARRTGDHTFTIQARALNSDQVREYSCKD